MILKFNNKIPSNIHGIRSKIPQTHGIRSNVPQNDILSNFIRKKSINGQKAVYVGSHFSALESKTTDLWNKDSDLWNKI